MLTAVAKMMATPKTSPLSWTFQWYTHFIPTAKPATITASLRGDFDKPPALACQTRCGTRANPTWGSRKTTSFPGIACTSSSSNRSSDPCSPTTPSRFLTGTTLSPALRTAYCPLHSMLPRAIRLLKSLFLPNRNTGVNSGIPIDNGQPGVLGPDSLTQTTYSPSGPKPGFCCQILMRSCTATSTCSSVTPPYGQHPLPRATRSSGCTTATSIGSGPVGTRHGSAKSQKMPPSSPRPLSSPTTPENGSSRKSETSSDIAPLHYTYDVSSPYLPRVGAPVANVPAPPRPPSTVASAAAIYAIPPEPLKVPLAKPFPWCGHPTARPGGPVSYYVVIEGLNVRSPTGCPLQPFSQSSRRDFRRHQRRSISSAQSTSLDPMSTAWASDATRDEHRVHQLRHHAARSATRHAGSQRRSARHCRSRRSSARRGTPQPKLASLKIVSV